MLHNRRLNSGLRPIVPYTESTDIGHRGRCDESNLHRVRARPEGLLQRIQGRCQSLANAIVSPNRRSFGTKTSMTNAT